MSELYIHTAQNVRITQVPASVAERILAHIIDYILFGGYALIFLLALGGIFKYSLTYMIVASLPILFYDLICEITMDGQTAGKKAMRIKVVKEDGSAPDMVSYFIRWVFRPVETTSMGAVATLTCIINGKGKRLGDIVAGTRMIRINKKGHENLDILSEFSDDYKPFFPEAINLNDKNIQIIREVLSYYDSHGGGGNSKEMAEKTKKAIEKKLFITSDWYPYNFLERILKDYTFLSLDKT